MNPSSSGWIIKYGSLMRNEVPLYATFEELYRYLRRSGFVYGFSLSTPTLIKSDHKLAEDEKAKINLLHALYHTYNLHVADAKFETFLVGCASILFRFKN